jgi:predicted permease
MVEIFFKTLPFFLLIGLGYWAGRTRFFSEEATAYLTKFVFYFALSAMLFGFTSNLRFEELVNWPFLLAYLSATMVVYLFVTAVSLLRGRPAEEAAFEAQCGVIGNVGFLGIPMLVLLLGPGAVGPVVMVLAVDLIVFGSLIVIIVSASRGTFSWGIFPAVGLGLLRNPMIVSITLGLLWSAFALPIPGPMAEFLQILGAAATPGALFAIGASLASKSAERLTTAVELSAIKLLLHPAAVSVAALLIFEVEPYAAGVMIAAAALPVAGNVYILAQHYRVAPQRVSATILISTAASIFTISGMIALVTAL